MDTIYTEWNQNLSTKIERIDKQHQELFGRINALIKAMREDKGQEEVLNTLKFLEEYIIIHFGEEEYLQRRYNYPNYLAHKAMHEKFLEEFYRLKLEVINGKPDSFFVFVIKEKLSDWLFKHINHIDKNMAEHLLEYMD